MDTPKTLYVNVKVHPRSRKQEISVLGEKTYKIHVTSAPSKGEANREVCKLIATYLDVPISRVKIIRGQKSQNKLIAIEHG